MNSEITDPKREELIREIIEKIHKCQILHSHLQELEMLQEAKTSVSDHTKFGAFVLDKVISGSKIMTDTKESLELVGEHSDDSDFFS